MSAVLKYCLYIAIGYGVLVLAVYLLQRKMLYFPDRQRPSENYVSSLNLAFWPQEGSTFKGYTGATPPDTVTATVIAFHGNAGSAWHRGYFVHALEPLGFRVILAEYPGYGGRDGVMSEESFAADAIDIVRLASEQFDDPIYLLGESMGCGVVAAVAANPPVALAGLVLITPWDSLPDLAQSLYWYLPARYLTRDQYDNVSNLKDFQNPIAMAIADSDEIIPNKHSLRLYEAITAPKQLWRFRNAGHNSWPTHPQNNWWRETMEFVSSARD